MNYTATYLNDLRQAQESVSRLEVLKNSRILVTGATGLVCSAIVDFLLQYNDTANAGINVYVTARSLEKAKDRFCELLNRKDVAFIEYDAMKDIDWDFETDYVIHGASPANPALYRTHPVETMLTNVLGLNNILSYAAKHRVKRVLFVSSSEVYGHKDNAEPYRTSEYGYLDILNPRACYPSAKRACETLCAAYKEEYGVDSVIARLGHVYGPTARSTDNRASSQFFFDVIDGNAIVMKSAGVQLRSYTYTVDCASAILHILINGETVKAYNISNSSSVVSIRSLAEQIAACSGKQVIFENPSDEEKKGYNLMDNSSLDSTELLMSGWKGLFDLQKGVSHTLSILKNE